MSKLLHYRYSAERKYRISLDWGELSVNLDGKAIMVPRRCFSQRRTDAQNPSALQPTGIDENANEARAALWKERVKYCMTIERGGKCYDKPRAKLHKEGYRLVHVVTPGDFYVHSSIDYNTTFPERVKTRLRST
jgi:hypothetical protein